MCLKVQELSDEMVLVQDSQEMKAILQFIGYPGIEDYGCLFIRLTPDGTEYDSVYGLESNTPHPHLTCDEVLRAGKLVT